MKKIVLPLVILCVIGLFLIGFFWSTVYKPKMQSIKIAKELVGAISYHETAEIKEIVEKHPESINTLPSASSWFWYVITEQPTILYPLQAACWGGEYDIVKILVDNGADVNLIWEKAGGQSSQSPLTLAVLSDSEDAHKIVKLLLESGAKKDIQDGSGRTAYDHAISRGDFELAELLKP